MSWLVESFGYTNNDIFKKIKNDPKLQEEIKQAGIEAAKNHESAQEAEYKKRIEIAKRLQKED